VTLFRQQRRDFGPGEDLNSPGSDDPTEHLNAIRPASWDGTTLTFSGASGAGLPPGGAFRRPGEIDASGWDHPDELYADAEAAGLRQAIETTALAERGPGPGAGPARLRALPPPAAPVPAAPPAPVGQHDDDRIARGMARGWAHLFVLRCEFPAADVATPIPCGSAHRDEGARSFRGLRASAQAAGWHLDALGRWACPLCCQDSPGYRTLYPLTVWDPDAAEARLARDPDGEFWARAAAEHDLFRSVRDARARHAGGPR
jgi:hypothetical protein